MRKEAVKERKWTPNENSELLLDYFLVLLVLEEVWEEEVTDFLRSATGASTTELRIHRGERMCSGSQKPS